MIQNFLNKVKGIFNVITLFELLFSLICIVLGITFFSTPTISNTFVSVVTGIIFILNGIVCIFSYFKRGDISIYNNNLIYGCILVVSGILIASMKNFLSIMLAIYLIIVAIQRVNIGLILKKFKESSWLITFVIGILFLAIGIVTIFANEDAIIKIAGIYLIGYGLINLINIILLRNRSSYFLA